VHATARAKVPASTLSPRSGGAAAACGGGAKPGRRLSLTALVRVRGGRIRGAPDFGRSAARRRPVDHVAFLVEQHQAGRCQRARLPGQGSLNRRGAQNGAKVGVEV